MKCNAAGSPGLARLSHDAMGRSFLAWWALAAVAAVADEAAETCRDADERCAAWAAHGECEANPNYMLSECAVSCASCASEEAPAWTGGCFDRDTECGDWADRGECDANPTWRGRVRTRRRAGRKKGGA